jgi:DNA-binding transcriptional LysR family regulator
MISIGMDHLCYPMIQGYVRGCYQSNSLLICCLMHKTDLPKFDLNLLMVFDALMREQHAGRAGESLGLTQPAVSHALGRLRHLVNDPLFVKHARGMRPTPRAEALADAIAPALRALRSSLKPDDAFDPATIKRTIVIGGSDYVDLTLLPRLMNSLRQAAPGFEIRLRPISRETVLGDLRRQEIDFAIGPLAAAPEGVDVTPLFRERLVLIGRRDHPALKHKPTVEEFTALSHLLVSRRGDAFGSVDNALRELGHSRRIAITVPHFLAAPFIVGATDLVAVVAERVALRLAEAAGLSVYELPITVPAWTVGLARLKEMPDDPAIDWLIKLISAIAREI